ncbi:reactive intermediate/imine deaminase [Paenibacillus baekrokdamisoli]|uniref:Reactive intermediate/imine deaminase n=1 Tax=Paenibacillus baekrokdamisoli TaxID=1712516 RepID=A0A3G9JMZ5_9BACL|nr:RidA family protein [Paenibacillus baekrokdamisoli]MBB3071784.1 2-iminobutanoate/2-iminopropanoate deaminase [Paenibacillus baekrokdamisoli]BBH24234.1 reactive intermediate/imine deaminase [Paenibacillus baekrokdamisoli]
MNDDTTISRLAPKPFSSSFQTDSCLYISGQGGLDPLTGDVVGSDIESQTVSTMEHIRRILIEAGLSLKDVVKVNVYLTDRSLYNEFNEVYARFFEAPYPARTTIYCDLNYDLLVEIDAIAVDALKKNTRS